MRGFFKKKAEKVFISRKKISFKIANPYSVTAFHFDSCSFFLLHRTLVAKTVSHSCVREFDNREFVDIYNTFFLTANRFVRFEAVRFFIVYYEV